MKNQLIAAAACAVAFGALTVGAWAAPEVPAQPTFYKDVLPIFQENCQLCHRDKGANFGGMVAPMALIDYEQVRPWAKAIAKQVSTKMMPPWKASPDQSGHFANERVLTQSEIDTIVRWVDQGTKAGNPSEAPAAKEFPLSEDGWLIGKPDLIVKMPEPYFIADEVEDTYENFQTVITDEQLPENRWVKAVEFRGGSKAVHHIIAPPLGGMAPGYDPLVYREGYGHVLRKGSTVEWQMHYHKEPGPGTGVWDQSEAGIVFWPEGTVIEHTTSMERLGAFNFRIPPGDPRYEFRTDFTFPEDSLILSYNPHMHVRGSYAKYTAKFPDGREEVLLEVPKYDFNWQITYTYKEPRKVPAGTVVELVTAWDNSANNPANPDPTQEVRWGQPTTDEMMFGWMKYTHVEPRPITVGEQNLTATEQQIEAETTD